ncbi:MAG: hypothetical protein FWE84_01330 [Firmicutes bacterium]|nr:hypothetical protein [Bacillota bacterium]
MITDNKFVIQTDFKTCGELNSIPYCLSALSAIVTVSCQKYLTDDKINDNLIYAVGEFAEMLHHKLHAICEAVQYVTENEN